MTRRQLQSSMDMDIKRARKLSAQAAKLSRAADRAWAAGDMSAFIWLTTQRDELQREATRLLAKSAAAFRELEAM